MTRKRPLINQCPNSPSRRRSARRRYSKSPTKLQYQHDTKTRLPPSSPLSGTSGSLYGDIGYQSPVPISIPSSASDNVIASMDIKAKEKGKKVDSATCSPLTDLPNTPWVLTHGELKLPHMMKRVNSEGESSQSTGLSSPPPSLRRADRGQHLPVDGKLGESSQSSRRSAPLDMPDDHMPTSPWSPPPDHTHQAKKPRTRRGRSPSSPRATISDPDDDIGLSMKYTWENLFANLGEVPKVQKEGKPLHDKAVEPIRKREPTKLPSR